MREFNLRSPALVGILSSVLLLLMSATVPAQSTEQVAEEGVIKARNGDIMILHTSNSPALKVLLTSDTEVGQVEGLLQVRRKDMSIAALIPGLAVKVQATHNDQGELVAKSVSFKGNDLERAETIQAGLHETQVQTEENKQAIKQHNAAIQQQHQQISANKEAIDAAVARFGELDDYYILDEVTVYFDNGQAEVDQQYVPQLQLAEKAASINGYVIEVKGHASQVGSKSVNQQLSEDRANNVTNILVQQGHIPLTRMLAPAAMGESHPVATGGKETEQAENRRVVVRVLQNKAIAGM